MTQLRMRVRAAITDLGDDVVEVVMSTAELARDGHILLPQGCILDNYRANPIVLWQHDPEHPIGNAENIAVGANQITARVRFAPAGISAKADEIRGLMKAGVLRGWSVGFDPIEGEPLDPKKPRGGQRISAWELLELSAVSVGADVKALTTARSNGDKDMADWKVGAAKGLPIEDSDDWDGAAAEASIFEWAGGDDLDPAKARKGFLVYDAEKPKERGSYKLPIAHVVDGELKVPKGAIRAAASRLPDTDIPDEVKTAAGKVLDHYKTEAGIGEDDGERRSPRKMKRVKVASSVARSGPVTFKRGLYQVAGLAYLLGELGYQLDMAKWEAECEGDQSKVPAMLAAVLQDLGDALLAMTAEEVAELLAGHGLEVESCDYDEVLMVEERTHVRAAKSPAVRAFRRALAQAKVRAGKTLSADTVDALREAQGHHEEAARCMRSAMAAHRKASGALDDLMDRAGVTDEADDEAHANGAQDGEAEDAERGLSFDYRQRQADLAVLTADID